MRHHQSGMAIRAIARIMALDRRTVRHWIHAGGFAERAQRSPAVSKLDPYRLRLRTTYWQNALLLPSIAREIGYPSACGENFASRPLSPAAVPHTTITPPGNVRHNMRFA
ncbi:hypothetical protein KPG66_13435 [Mycetohabitans sp. B2]|nr:hypothetical protein [Mycetohabitans sp. B2]MCG1048769.1 hypothetical protein [Mycetohabitans sp. B6]